MVSTRSLGSYRTGTQNCISWPLATRHAACLKHLFLDHAQAESYIFTVHNIKSLIRCQHAHQIKFQLWAQQAGKRCHAQVLHRSFTRLKTRQSSPHMQLHRPEQSHWLRAAEDYSNYVQIGHRDHGKWLGCNRAKFTCHLASAFGSALSIGLPSAAKSRSTSRRGPWSARR